MNYLLSESQCIALVKENPGAILELLPAQRTAAVWAVYNREQATYASLLPTHNPIKAGLMWEGFIEGVATPDKVFQSTTKAPKVVKNHSSLSW